MTRVLVAGLIALERYGRRRQSYQSHPQDNRIATRIVLTARAGWLVAFAATLGLGYGVRIALTPVVLIEFFGIGNLGAVLGVFFTASSISAVCGPLVAGLIIDQTGSYQWGVAFALAIGVLGFIAVAPLRPRAH